MAAFGGSSRRSFTATVSTAANVAQCSRQARAYHPSRSACNAGSSSSRKVTRRKQLTERDVDGGAVDLVGPPDPLSNIRPMLYAELRSTQRTKQGGQIVAADAMNRQDHPYSVNEFSQQRSSAKRKGIGVFGPFYEYVDRVGDRMEEAEMKLRLSKLTTDATTQRFWRDNNARFSRDLLSWQRQHEVDDGIAAHPNADQKGLVVERDQSRDLIAGLSSESDFYATWLRANAKRNRAYNILVWRQAFDQVIQGARVSILRTWLAFLRRFS